MVKKIILIIFIFYTFNFSEKLLADEKNIVDLSIGVGAGFFPSDFRLSVKAFQMGVNFDHGYYAGGRWWAKNFYTGIGIVGKGDIGPYGIFGAEWRPIRLLGLYIEGFGAARYRGYASGLVQIGVSLGW